MAVTVFAGILICAAAGLLLLSIGLKGRVVDNHPVCARCRRDLIGVFPFPPSVKPVCPDCGASLSRPNSLEVGNRGARRGVVAAGSALFALSAAAVLALAIADARGVSWNALKPTWMLLREATAGSPTESDAAIAELANRLDDPEFGETNATPLIARSLAAHADRSRTWSPGLGDLIEGAAERGWLRDAELERYGALCVTFDITTPASVGTGENLRASVTVLGARVGARSDLHATVRLLTSTLAGENSQIGWESPAIPLRGLSKKVVPAELLVQLPPGHHDFRTTWAVEISREGSAAPIHRRTIEVNSSLHVGAFGEQVGTAAPGPG